MIDKSKILVIVFYWSAYHLEIYFFIFDIVLIGYISNILNLKFIRNIYFSCIFICNSHIFFFPKEKPNIYKMIFVVQNVEPHCVNFITDNKHVKYNEIMLSQLRHSILFANHIVWNSPQRNKFLCCKLHEKDVLVRIEDVLLITKTNFIWIFLFVCKYIKKWIFWCIMVKQIPWNTVKMQHLKYFVRRFVCDENKFSLRPFYQNTNNNDKIIIKWQ